VSNASALTRQAEVVLTVALGLAGTSSQAFEPPEVFPPVVARSVTNPSPELFITSSDLSGTRPDQSAIWIDFTRSDSRWYGYVSRRLRELRDGKYDFTGFEIPSSEVIEQARFVAMSLFRPDTPTPSVVPSEEGDVLYVWHKSGWDLEIDVGPEATVVWAHERNTGGEWYGALENLRAEVVNLLDYLAWR
jgi:hypothetical protein